jgi:hypothetical protein
LRLLSQVLLDRLDEALELFVLVHFVFRVGRQDEHVEDLSILLDELHHVSALSVEFGSLLVVRLHLFLHHDVVRITDKRNNKVEQHHEDEPLV